MKWRCNGSQNIKRAIYQKYWLHPLSKMEINLSGQIRMLIFDRNINFTVIKIYLCFYFYLLTIKFI